MEVLINNEEGVLDVTNKRINSQKNYKVILLFSIIFEISSKPQNKNSNIQVSVRKQILLCLTFLWSYIYKFHKQVPTH